MSARLRTILFAVAFALLAFAPGAWAAPGVSVTMVSSPRLTLDSNTPCTGPQAAYVSFQVTNTSGTTQTNLRSTISGFAGGITLAGGQAAGQWIGTLAPGASRTLWWFVSYPCTFGISNALVVSVSDNTAGSTTGIGTVTTSSMISAQAGGIVNTATLGAGAVVGQTITMDVSYDFGGASANDTYNLQPAGNNTFSGGCFQLVRTTVTSSNVPAIPTGTENQQYFTATASATGNGYTIVIRYYFKYLCAGVTTLARPYSNQNSGTQLKYSSNYQNFAGGVGISYPGATNPFVVTKSVTPTAVPSGSTVTYTVVISNPSSYNSEVDSIVDVLPSGVVYGGIAPGSQVTTGSLPASGSTGTIVWRGSQPTPYAIPAQGSLTLKYTATIAAAGQYTNSVRAITGTTQLGQTASATVTVGTANLSVTKTGPDSVVVSDTIKYVLTVRNLGPERGYGVVLSDTLPVGVTFVRATRTPTLVGRVLTWPSLATLDSGAVRTDTVVVVAPATLGSMVNVGAASSSSYDSDATNNNGTAPASRVTTTMKSSISVTPDGLASPTPRLPGGAYGQAFNVQNLSPAPGTYALSLRTTATGAAAVFIAVDSVTGPGIATPASYATATVPLGGRTTTVYTVWYRVLAGDTAVNTQFLRARAVSDTLLRDDGFAEVRRVRPVLTLSKTVSPTGTLASGTDLTYTLKIANVGEYAARAVTVTDSVPTQVMFKVGSVSQTLPSGLTAAVAYRDSTGAAITPGGNAACMVTGGYDSCVRRIVWTLSGDLPAGASLSDGQFAFIARIK
ncbi:MAG TPA: hypothetical protein VF584_17590 [Longimicrobium sp.]|jgi:uncharacterized repeat protein (TIGR01451 family)